MTKTHIQSLRKGLLRPYLLLPLLAFIITLLVLFIAPYPGMSDQGDFERMINTGGLTRTQEAIDAGNQNFVHTIFGYGYFPILQILQIFPSSSLVYPIALCWLPCLFGVTVFSTHVLAVVQLLLYAFAFGLFLRGLYKIKPAVSWIAGVLGVFILFDAGYTVWMNSLYQECALYTGFLLVIGAALNMLADQKKISAWGLAGLFFACFYFMLSKVQVISTLPIVLVLFAVIGWKFAGTRRVRAMTAVGLCLIVGLSGWFYLGQRGDQGDCTTYNSLFYGLLMDSDTPQQDLAELGLAPEHIQDVGKHAFLPENEYYCPPYSQMAQERIYDKIGTFDVVKFYLKHPSRLIGAMEYMGKNVFDTASTLGKYEEYQVPEYTMEIGRFDGYHHLRGLLPKNLYFLIGLFLALAAYLITTLVKAKDNRIRALAWMLVFCALVCCVQFPLPIFGNGHADTMKQTFLFTYAFDIGLILWICTAFLQINNRRKGKSFR